MSGAGSYAVGMSHRPGPDEIVVVAGIPRSGTSLLMQMLGAGGMPLLCDGVRAPDPDNPRGYFELEAARRLARESGWLVAARGRAVKIVHALVPELPAQHRYRVLLVERRMDEVLASQERMLARAAQRDGTPPPAADERLGAVFAAQSTRLKRWLDAQPNVRWLLVPHADLIARPLGWAARIDEFLGGVLDRDAMASVVEPSLYRARGAPAGAGPVSDRSEVVGSCSGPSPLAPASERGEVDRSKRR